MISANNYYNNSDEFIFERLVGWSSACLDSTIYYYLNHNQVDGLEYEQVEDHKNES